MTTISREIDDEDFKIEALHHRWGTAYFFGQTAKLIEYAEGVEHYDRDRHHKFSYVFAGHDPGACAYCSQAVGLGIAGRSRSVRPVLEAGLALATSLQHPLTLVLSQLRVLRDASCSGFGRMPGVRRTAHADIGQIRFTGYPRRRIIRAGRSRCVARRRHTCAQANGAILRSDAWLRIYRCAPRRHFGRRAGERTTQSRSVGIGHAASRQVEYTVGAPFSPSYGGFARDGTATISSQFAESERFFGTALRIADEQGANVFRLTAGIPLAQMLAEGGRTRGGEVGSRSCKCNQAGRVPSGMRRTWPSIMTV